MAEILLQVPWMKENCRIVLASSSPRRQEILRLWGLPFEVVSPKFAEDLDKSEYTPQGYVMANARIKCAEVVMKLAHPRYPQPEYDDKVLIVIGADTVVDAAHALTMLKHLQGRDHQVITGMAVSVAGAEPVAVFEETLVSFAEMKDEELKAYIETGEPFDKAGGYGIQAVGCLLVTGIQGNYQNVVGLPLAALSKLIVAELDRHLKGPKEVQPLKMNGAEPRIQGNLLGTLEGTLQQLRQEVAMRDQEISMLVGSLSKRGNNAKEAAAAGPIFIPAAAGTSAAGTSAGAQGQENEGPASTPERVAGADSAALLLDRNKAFDAFRKSVRRSETLDEGRDTRKQLVIEAKEVGERANAARAVERLGRMMGSGPHDPSCKENVVPTDTPEVAALEREKEEKISTYKKCMERLKVVKAEIEKHKSAAKENQDLPERLQRDFEAWYLSLQAHQADLNEAAGPASDSGPRPASNSAKEPRKVTAAGAPAVPAATSLQSPPLAPAEAFTGHQQTDDDIRAYFAAVADLESRRLNLEVSCMSIVAPVFNFFVGKAST
eukprot:s1409_g19.t4